MGVFKTVGFRGDDNVLRVIFVSLFLLSGLAFTSSTNAAPTYRVIDLGTLGRDFSSGRSVNDNGHVTGEANQAFFNRPHAFLYDGTTMNDTETNVNLSSIGLGINNSGQVTGDRNPTNFGRAFLYDDATTTFTDLGTLGGNTSQGRGINSSGQVAGFSFNSTGGERGFFYDGSTMIDVGSLGTGAFTGDFVEANAINDNSLVTGRSSTSVANELHAYIYDGTTATMSDIGTLGGNISRGFAINNNGDVTGRSTNGSGFKHAFLYDGATMSDLGTLSGDRFSTGFGMNELGQVVGVSISGTNEFDDTAKRAFLWDATDNIMRDLNNLIDPSDPLLGSIDLRIAYSINEFGQITGEGFIGGETHAFLLVDDSNLPPVSAVPLPAALPLYGTGLAVMGFLGWRRKQQAGA